MGKQAPLNEISIHEACELVTDGTHYTPPHVSEGLPFLTVKDMLRSGLDFENCSHIHQAEFKKAESGNCVPKKDDVLFSKDGTVGKVHVVNNEKPFAVLSSIAILRPKSGVVDSNYLGWMLQSPQAFSQAVNKKTGSAIRRIILRDLKQVIIPLVDIDEQRRIVARIKECMERVGEIERIKSTMQKDYEALKFSTVSHVIDNISVKSQTVTIGELVASNKTAMRSGPFGSAMKHHEFVDNGNLVIGIANVQENRFNSVRKWMITNQKYDQMSRYAVQSGDLLITIMGTIGRTCVVPENIGKAITSKHVYRIRFPNTINPYYISYVVNYDFKARKQLYGTAIGGVMPGLNATKLRALKLLVPPKKLQDEIVLKLDEAHAALQERANLDFEEELSFLRESILRKAFAGEL